MGHYKQLRTHNAGSHLFGERLRCKLIAITYNHDCWALDSGKVATGIGTADRCPQMADKSLSATLCRHVVIEPP
jgi:hypothetical protein